MGNFMQANVNLYGEENENRSSGHSWRGRLLVIAIIIALALAAFVILQIRHFTEITLEDTLEVEGAAASEYVMFGSNIVKYNNDGATSSDNTGHMVWDETYEMADPTLEQSDGYLMIYDKNGTSIHVMSETGTAGVLTTSLPITYADVSSSGTVAVLMQNGGTGHIELMSYDGTILASGEVHFENTGYPMSIAISPNSEKLVVSLLSVTDGVMKTVVNFYNFGSAGQKEIDNIVSTYEYEGTVIPEVDFVSSGRAIAFGNDKIILYDASSRPKESRTIEPLGDMSSVLHNDNYFGYITQEEDEETKEMQTVVEIYTTRGYHRYSQVLDSSDEIVQLMDNDELLVTDQKNVKIYNIYGVNRFEYTFDNTIYALLPQIKAREYVVVYQDSIDKFMLR